MAQLLVTDTRLMLLMWAPPPSRLLGRDKWHQLSGNSHHRPKETFIYTSWHRKSVLIVGIVKSNIVCDALDQNIWSDRISTQRLPYVAMLPYPLRKLLFVRHGSTCYYVVSYVCVPIGITKKREVPMHGQIRTRDICWQWLQTRSPNGISCQHITKHVIYSPQLEIWHLYLHMC